jgi:hypothetical protein
VSEILPGVDTDADRLPFVLQHPVPEPLLARIGDITVSFAMLESQIQSFVGSLIYEHQRIGQIITAELSFSNLRALALSLFRERHGEENLDFGRLRDLMKHAGELEAKRNQITHSIWGAGGSSDSVTRIKTTAKERHGIRFDFTRMSEADLGNIAVEIKTLAHDVQRLYLDLVTTGLIVNNPIAPTWGPGAGLPPS